MQYGSPKMFMKKSDSERALVAQDRYRIPTFRFLEGISTVEFTYNLRRSHAGQWIMNSKLFRGKRSWRWKIVYRRDR